MADAEISVARLLQNIVLQQEDFAGIELPIHIGRNFTVTGSGMLDLNGVTAKVSVAGGVVFRLQDVTINNLYVLPAVVASLDQRFRPGGLPLFYMGPTGQRAVVQMYNCTAAMVACPESNVIEVFAPFAGLARSCPVFNQTFSDCSGQPNPAGSPLPWARYDVCFGADGLCISADTWVGSLAPAGYDLHILDSVVLCEYGIKAECTAAWVTPGWSADNPIGPRECFILPPRPGSSIGPRAPPPAPALPLGSTGPGGGAQQEQQPSPGTSPGPAQPDDGSGGGGGTTGGGSDSSEVPIGAVVGGAVGGAIAASTLVVLLLYWRHRRKRRSDEAAAAAAKSTLQAPSPPPTLGDATATSSSTGRAASAALPATTASNPSSGTTPAAPSGAGTSHVTAVHSSGTSGATTGTGTGYHTAASSDLITHRTPLDGIEMGVLLEHQLAEAVEAEEAEAERRQQGGPHVQPPARQREAAGVEVKLLPEALGAGTFGSVRKGLYRGQVVAVKVVAEVHATGGALEMLVASFAQEVEVLGRCRHPNVVRLLAACLTPPKLCLVMELMDGSLHWLLYKSGGGLLPLDKVLHIGIHVARGLNYLHPTVVHRDLKPANVLLNRPLDPEPIVKIADFGLSRLRSTMAASTKTPEAGTPAYLPPEAFDPTNSTISIKLDIYALGVLLWEMLAGQPPWLGMSIVQIALAVLMYRRRLPLLDLPRQRCPPRLARLIAAMWEHDPMRRPSADEVAKGLMLVAQGLDAPPDMELSSSAAESSNVDGGARSPPAFSLGGPPEAPPAPAAAVLPNAGGSGVEGGRCGMHVPPSFQSQETSTVDAALVASIEELLGNMTGASGGTGAGTGRWDLHGAATAAAAGAESAAAAAATVSDGVFVGSSQYPWLQLPLLPAGGGAGGDPSASLREGPLAHDGADGATSAPLELSLSLCVRELGDDGGPCEGASDRLQEVAVEVAEVQLEAAGPGAPAAGGPRGGAGGA